MCPATDSHTRDGDSSSGHLPRCARHNKQTHVQPANFTVGDFVLVAQRIQNDQHKLRVKWRGPKRVTRVCSECIFEVRSLLTLQHVLIYGNRLKIYTDSKLNVIDTLLDTIAHNDSHLNTVPKLLDLRFNTDK
jgi:hypothetical protein